MRLRNKASVAVVSWAIVALWALPGMAAILPGFAVLNGAQEVPPNASTATGVGTLTLDTTNNLLNFTSVFVQGISKAQLFGVGAGLTPVHIHEAPAGVNGPIRVPFDFPTIVDIPGGFLLTALNVPVTPALALAMIAGNTYFNVHTATFNGGEIRGQITITPIPAALPLLATALGGLAFLRKRRASS